MKRLIIALLCLIAVNAVVSCEGYDDYAKNLKSKSLTKDEAKADNSMQPEYRFAAFCLGNKL